MSTPPNAAGAKEEFWAALQGGHPRRQQDPGVCFSHPDERELVREVRGRRRPVRGARRRRSPRRSPPNLPMLGTARFDLSTAGRPLPRGVGELSSCTAGCQSRVSELLASAIARLSTPLTEHSSKRGNAHETFFTIGRAKHGAVSPALWTAAAKRHHAATGVTPGRQRRRRRARRLQGTAIATPLVKVDGNRQDRHRRHHTSTPSEPARFAPSARRSVVSRTDRCEEAST